MKYIIILFVLLASIGCEDALKKNPPNFIVPENTIRVDEGQICFKSGWNPEEPPKVFLNSEHLLVEFVRPSDNSFCVGLSEDQLLELELDSSARIRAEGPISVATFKVVEGSFPYLEYAE